MSEGSEGTQAAETVSKAEYEKVLTKARNEEARAVDYERRFKGIDPEAVKAEREELANLRREGVGNDPKKLKEFEERTTKEVSERYSGKLTEYETENKTIKAQLKELQVTNTAMTKAASIFNDDALELIQDRVRADCDFQDGKIIVRGSDGKPRPSVKNPREDMGVDEYLETLASKYPSTAKATAIAGGKGGGAKSETNGKGSGKDLDLNVLRRQPDGGLRMMQEAGPDAVRKLYQS